MLEVLQSAWHWHWRTIEAGCWARGRDWWGAPWWGRPLPGVRWIQCDHPQHTPPPAWQLTGISSVRWGQEQLLIAIKHVRWRLIPDMKEWSQSCNSNGRGVGVGGRSKLFDYEGISFCSSFSVRQVRHFNPRRRGKEQRTIPENIYSNATHV